MKVDSVGLIGVVQDFHLRRNIRFSRGRRNSANSVSVGIDLEANSRRLGKVDVRRDFEGFGL